MGLAGVLNLRWRAHARGLVIGVLAREAQMRASAPMPVSQSRSFVYADAGWTRAGMRPIRRLRTPRWQRGKWYYAGRQKTGLPRSSRSPPGGGPHARARPPGQQLLHERHERPTHEPLPASELAR